MSEIPVIDISNHLAGGDSREAAAAIDAAATQVGFFQIVGHGFDASCLDAVYDAVLALHFAYSKSEPRLEIIRTVPGSLWEPADSGIHHLGSWSDDVAADSTELERRGFEPEATGRQPDGTPYWSVHRAAMGPRIELVSRSVQAGLEHYWATGGLGP